MLDVIDLSKYIIAYADEILEYPIDNLQLQKILYYIKGNLLAKFDYTCFEDDMVASCAGPYIAKPYFAFHRYGVYRIRVDNYIKFDENNRDILLYLDSIPTEIRETINSIIKEKSKMDSWDLSIMSINEKPWKSTKLNSNISNEILKSAFKKKDGGHYAE